MLNAILKSWIPSAGGIVVFLSVLFGELSLFFDTEEEGKPTTPDFNKIIAAAGVLVIGLSSRQSNKSDEQVGAGRK